MSQAQSVRELGESGDREEEPFPTRLAFSVWIVQLYNGIQYAEIFTLGVYIVRSFEGEDATEQRIGQLAGLLAGASAFAVGIAAWPWGLLSDRIGRKPVILIGNSATAACILMFGTAKVYWIALLSRLLAGSLDGSLVMTKVMVGESCTPYMQARVMSYLALGDAMGNILGPALGGLLANPCTRFTFLSGTAMCNEGSLFARYPFLLPCALTACLGLMTSITNVLTMDETLASRRPGPKYARLPPQSSEVELSEGPQGGSTLGLAAGPTDSDAASLGEFISDSELAVAQGMQDRKQDAQQAHSTSPRSMHHGMATRHSGAMEPQASEGRKLRVHDSVQSSFEQPLKKSADAMHIRWEDESENISDEEKGYPEKQSVPQDAPWWQNRPLLMTLVVTALMLSIAKYNDELGPVFVSAPVKQGGLGMPLDAFALPLSFGGVVLTLFAIFGYPRLQRAVGLKMTCSIGLLTAIPGDLILPAAALLQWQPILEQAAIFSAIAITKLTTQTAFTASMVIINSIAPRPQLGSVNGVRMMMAALGRSSGPLLGGTIWGLSATMTLPGHHFLGFLVASVALVGCWYLHHRTPIHIDT